MEGEENDSNCIIFSREEPEKSRKCRFALTFGSTATAAHSL